MARLLGEAVERVGDGDAACVSGVLLTWRIVEQEVRAVGGTRHADKVGGDGTFLGCWGMVCFVHTSIVLVPRNIVVVMCSLYELCHSILYTIIRCQSFAGVYIYSSKPYIVSV